MIAAPTIVAAAAPAVHRQSRCIGGASGWTGAADPAR
jgi:hypothetical protein